MGILNNLFRVAKATTRTAYAVTDKTVEVVADATEFTADNSAELIGDVIDTAVSGAKFVGGTTVGFSKSAVEDLVGDDLLEELDLLLTDPFTYGNLVGESMYSSLLEEEKGGDK